MRNKKILMGVLFVAIIVSFLFIFPNTVNAAVSHTRNIYSNNGSMKFNFTGLTLDETHEYEFGLTRTKAAAVEKWHTITEYTETTAILDVMTTTVDLRNVINAVDTGYVTIKDKTSDTIILEPTAVDLKTPFLSLTNFTVIENGKEFSTSQSNSIQIALRNASNSKAYYQYEKITDTNIINTYKELKANSGDYLELQSMLKQTAPTSNWQTWVYWNGYDSASGMGGYGYTQGTIKAPDEGLYYMWLYFSGEGIKNVYGYILVDALVIDSISPTVSSIKVISPASGTYNTPQTVKIGVYFSEEITGSTVPTLKIKFGDSQERSISNGTIKNTGYTTPCIEYSYNIQDTDKGQLQTVSLTGGNITDVAGNAANLSSPILTGSITIKANVDGTTTNNTDNQDNKNDTTTENLTATVKYSSTKETTEPVTVTITANKKLTKINGWTLSSDGKTLTKTYTVNAKETVTLKDEAGKTTTVSVNISNIKAGNGTATPTPKATATPTPKDDTTIKTPKLPQTGEEIGIFLGIFAVIAIGTIIFVKYKKYEF